MTFQAEVDAEELEARRKAVESIKPFYEMRQMAAGMDKGIKQLDPSTTNYGEMGALRRFLMDHDGEVLVDGEANLKAYLAFSGETVAYDTPTAIKNRNAALHERLTELDCFVVDAKRVQDCIAKGLLMKADIEPFRHPLQRTPSLKIEKVKDSD